MSGVFAFLTASIDSALSTYVTSVSSSLAATLAPLVVTGLSVHYTLFGLAVMRGEADASLPKLAWNLAKHSMIFSIALTTAAYQEWAVDTVNATTGLLVQAASLSGATSLAIALDQMDAQGGDYAMTVLGHGMTLMPIGGWLDLIAGIVIMVSNLALMALIGIWGILAKVALTFVLAFGPLFISLLAFPATKKFFDAWLGKVLNYLLLTIFMAAVTTFSMRIAGSFVSQMMAAGDSSNSFSDAFGFALLSITLIVVTWQMPSIASGIAGGSAVSSPTGWAAALLAAGRRGGGGQDSSPAPARGGGEIRGQNATGNSNGGNADGPRRPVPAYRRTTLDQLGRK